MAGGGGARWLGAGQLRGDAGVRFRRVRTGPAGLGARLSPPRFHREGAQVDSKRAAVRLRRQTQDQKMKANNVAIGSGTPMNHTRMDLPTISSANAGLPPANAKRGIWFRPRDAGMTKGAPKASVPENQQQDDDRDRDADQPHQDTLAHRHPPARYWSARPPQPPKVVPPQL